MPPAGWTRPLHKTPESAAAGGLGNMSAYFKPLPPPKKAGRPPKEPSNAGPGCCSGTGGGGTAAADRGRQGRRGQGQGPDRHRIFAQAGQRQRDNRLETIIRQPQINKATDSKIADSPKA